MLKIRNILKYKKDILIIVFLNGQVYTPFISQLFTSFHKNIIKPKYDFWIH
jgi:hypothetical protein